MGCVCVNNGAEDAVFAIRPDPRLMKSARAIDMLTGRPIDMPVKLAGFSTMMIFFGPEPEAFEDTLCRAEDAFQRWKKLGADVGALRHYYSNARTGRHYARRYALALGMLSSMALRCSVEKHDDGLLVQAEAFDPDGNAVSDAVLRLRMVPGSMKQYPFRWNGEKYIAFISRDDIARVYDPDSCDYVPLTGAARCVIQAENDRLQGGCLMNVRL